MSRRFWLWLLAGFSLLGLLAVAWAFAGSFKPSEGALAARPTLKVPPLLPGGFSYVPHPVVSDQWSSEVLFVRALDGSLGVFEVPTLGGRFTMPDPQWWQKGPVCKVFEPDFQKNEIFCKDADALPWVREHFRWSLDGKSRYLGRLEDLLPVEGQIEGDTLTIGRRL